MVNLLRLSNTCRDIMIKKGFEDAIVVFVAFGGSADVVLFLLASAFEAEGELIKDDFYRIGEKIPHLGTLGLILVVTAIQVVCIQAMSGLRLWCPGARESVSSKGPLRFPVVLEPGERMVPRQLLVASAVQRGGEDLLGRP